MALKKLELQVPEDLLRVLGNTSKDVRIESLQRLVLSLVQDGHISASKGAEILDLSYRNMLDLMAEYNVPLISYDPKEVDEGLKALDKLLGPLPSSSLLFPTQAHSSFFLELGFSRFSPDRRSGIDTSQ